MRVIEDIDEAIQAGCPVVNVDKLAMRVGDSIVTRADVDNLVPAWTVVMVYDDGKRQFGTITALGEEARVASIHPFGEAS